VEKFFENFPLQRELNFATYIDQGHKEHGQKIWTVIDVWYRTISFLSSM